MSAPDPTAPHRETLKVPLKLRRIVIEKVWGGPLLERVLGLKLDAAGPVGETWELVDRGEQNSVVHGGLHDGRRLRELMVLDREGLLGDARSTEDGRFPLTIKFLSAAKPLSVQVHPDDRTAAKLHAGEGGKNEAWYILHAEPGSLIYLGLRPEVDATDFAAHAGTEDVVDLLMPWPVKAGDFVNVPAGTLHAIGEGIALLEVQQNSDVTYRLYDWGRAGLDGAPRVTHLEQALFSIDYTEQVVGPVETVLASRDGGIRSATLLDGEHFGMSLLEIRSHLDVKAVKRAKIYVVIEGEARLWLPEAPEPWEMVRGDTWLIPAEVGDHRLEARGELVKMIAVDTRS